MTPSATPESRYAILTGLIIGVSAAWIKEICSSYTSNELPETQTEIVIAVFQQKSKEKASSALNNNLQQPQTPLKRHQVIYRQDEAIATFYSELAKLPRLIVWPF